MDLIDKQKDINWVFSVLGYKRPWLKVRIMKCQKGQRPLRITLAVNTHERRYAVNSEYSRARESCSEPFLGSLLQWILSGADIIKPIDLAG